MPSTAKDPFTEVAAALNETQSSQPGDATSAEIPVTVHASRYSSASKGAAKLPPVHEETRTVIIFPQGAVVRLSASVTPGELVVLTNKRTGADVICRVTSVKTQPGIQNYVHLEFTQRALDYWEDPAAERAGAGRPQSITASPTPPAPTPIDSSHRITTPPIQEAQPAAKASLPAVELKPVPASLPPSSLPPSSLPKVTPLADLTAPAPENAPEEDRAMQSRVSEISASPALVQKQPHIMPSRTPRLQPFEPVLSQDKNGSKAIILFAIAAVVLLAVGAVGGAIFLRRDRGASVAQQFPSAPLPTRPAPVSGPSQSEAPIVDTSSKVNSFEPAVSTPAKSSPAETPVRPTPIRAAVESPKAPIETPKVEAPKAEAQPAPVAVSRPSINLGRISAPNVRAAQLNSSAPPPLLPAEGNALPSIVSEATAHTNALASAEPTPPPPSKGGQLQQPKLLASVAAVYPPAARAQHVQGDVSIDALIDPTGKVTATKVITGNPLLQSAAVESLRLWKYQPARLNGEAIPIHINVTITFHLK
jgi:TonB family protein